MRRGPTHADVAGASYLALRKLAREQERPTAELLQLYALEGFLALEVDSEPTAVAKLVAEVAGIEFDDGLAFLVDTLTASVIRDDDASTRWRDFADLHVMLDQVDLDDARVTASIAAVAHHRQVPLASISETLAGMSEAVQPRWQAWLDKHGMDGRVPRSFAEVLHVLDTSTRNWITAATEADSNSDPPD